MTIVEPDHPKPKRGHGPEKAAVLADIAEACTKHNTPQLDRGLKNMVAAAIGDLLKGGYDLDLIRHVAVETALNYDEVRRHQRLTQLRKRVRAVQSERDLDEHSRRKLAGRYEVPVDPAAAAAVRALLAKYRGGERLPDRWAYLCMAPGCTRTALLNQPTCVEHEK